MAILFITAFKDINRGSWDQYRRTNDEYYQWFTNLTSLPIKLVCFTDDPNVPRFEQVTYLPYDDTTTFQKYYEKEKAIMGSNYYKAILDNELMLHPEHNNPNYTIVNHNKVIFIERASKLYSGYTHYAWIDFGILRSKQKDDVTFIDNYEFPNDKIVYAAFPNAFHSMVFNGPLHTRMRYYSDNLIQGSCFIVPGSMCSWYRETYEAMLISLYNQNITDDDQIIVYEIIRLNTNKFLLFSSTRWFYMLSILFKNVVY